MRVKVRVRSIPLPLAGLVIVLDELGLDVLPQRVIVLGGPVSQDAGGELVFRVAGTTQDHLYHLLTGPAQRQRGVGLGVGQETAPKPGGRAR